MKKKKIKLNKILDYILLFLVVFFAFIAFSSYFAIPGGIRIFTVMTGSMEPTLKTGSLVFVKEGKDFKKDNIITFKKADDLKETITHRIVSVGEEDGVKYYEVKGDANPSADSEKVGIYKVIGRVFFWIPFLGYIVSFAKTPVGVIFLVVIPATVIIYEEIGNIRKEVKKWKKEKKKKLKEAKNE